MSTKPLSPSAACAAKCLYAAMKYLKQVGAGVPAREITKYLEENVQFTDWEKERAGKYQYIRWMADFQFYSVDYQKAGFIEKEGGLWYLTAEGEAVLSKTEAEVMILAKAAYKNGLLSIKKKHNPKSLLLMMKQQL